ncbi:hypothetical protein DCC79_01385 [bacterium]|nr:hypothetical protein [Chloroflexi bacterium CFX6]RIL12460.1 MAG: hypothetical protein DCC79_01385 [bacterium]
MTVLRLPPFDLIAPRTVAEAADALAHHGPSARLIAGGTDVLPNLKRGLAAPDVLVSLAGVESLRGIRPAADPRPSANGLRGPTRPPSTGAPEGITIGAATRLNRLMADPAVCQSFPVIREAVSQIATPTLRRMGTVGGNLCLDTRCTYYNRPALWREGAGDCMKHEGDVCRVAPGGERCWATLSADLPPVLVALDAVVRLTSARGDRVLALGDLYRDDGLTHLTLAPDEILAEVWVPVWGSRAAFLKLRPRCAVDFASLGVAVAVDVADGICRRARIVLGAVASHPLRVPAAEAALCDRAPDATAIRAAADAAYDAARPMDNADQPPAYRRQMVRVMVARALRAALGQPPSTR